MLELVGLTATLTPSPAVSETDAVALFEESAMLVAFTVTAVVVATDGAVYSPLLEIEPAVADHATAVLLVPLTNAENCSLVPVCRLEVEGDTETATELL